MFFLRIPPCRRELQLENVFVVLKQVKMSRNDWTKKNFRFYQISFKLKLSINFPRKCWNRKNFKQWSLASTLSHHFWMYLRRVLTQKIHLSNNKSSKLKKKIIFCQILIEIPSTIQQLRTWILVKMYSISFH